MTRKQGKQIITIVIIVTALFLVGSVVYLIFNKNNTATTNEFNPTYGKLQSPIEKNYFSEISITGINAIPQPPTSNNVYAIDTKDPLYPSKTLTSALSKKLNLKLQSSTTQFYYYDNNNISLSYDVQTKLITIKYKNVQIEDKPTLFNENQLKITAKAKLEELGIWPFEKDYRISFRNYNVSINNYYETLDKDSVSLVGTVFTSTTENIPLVTSRLNTGEIEVFINSDNQISKISYIYRPIIKTDPGTYPIKTLSSVASSIKSRNAEIVIPFDSEIPNTVKIDDLIFAYRILFKSQSFIQPVYIIEGTDNNNKLATFIVPAIENQYLTEPPKVE